MWKRRIPILIPQDPSCPLATFIIRRERVGNCMEYPMGEYFLQFEDTRVDMADDQTGKQENEIKSTLHSKVFVWKCNRAHDPPPFLFPKKLLFLFGILCTSCGVHENMQLLKSTNFASMTRRGELQWFYRFMFIFPTEKRGSCRVYGSKRGERTRYDVKL